MALPIKIELPQEFFKKEVRDGYEVAEKTKKIWAVQLDLFQELSRVCNKHGIPFQVCFGTLIGAVRHRGFIPWDDDFDVWMTRDNINRLIDLADEFSSPYFLQTPINDRKYITTLTRLRNSDTTAAITGYDTADYNNGIYIDIYAMDGVSTSKLRCALQYVMKRIVVRFWILRGQLGPRKRTFKEILFYFLKPLALIFSYEQWYRWYVGVLSMWTSSTDRLSHMNTMTWNGKKNWVAKAEINDTIMVQYETVEVPIPRNYDEILRRDYGDYMKFPPIEERGKWHDGKVHLEPDIPYKEYLNGRRLVGSDDAK